MRCRSVCGSDSFYIRTGRRHCRWLSCRCLFIAPKCIVNVLRFGFSFSHKFPLVARHSASFLARTETRCGGAIACTQKILSSPPYPPKHCENARGDSRHPIFGDEKLNWTAGSLNRRIRSAWLDCFDCSINRFAFTFTQPQSSSILKSSNRAILSRPHTCYNQRMALNRGFSRIIHPRGCECECTSFNELRLTFMKCDVATAHAHPKKTVKN